MQPDKFKQKQGELETIISNSADVADSLTDVMELFNTKKIFQTFDTLKRCGILVSQTLTILLIMPFYQIATVRAMFKSGLKEVEGKKDVYYDLKNNEKINWRLLLTLVVLRFINLIKQRDDLQKPGVKAIIFDDSPIEKTSKKTEKVSLIHDHVTGKFIWGYKLLVCGYWDGGSFIPVDFSFHREKGNKLDEALHVLKKAEAVLQDAQEKLEVAEEKYFEKKAALKVYRKKALRSSGLVHKAQLKNSEKAELKAKEKLSIAQKEVRKKMRQVVNARQHVKDTEKKHPAFGLNNKAKKKQFKNKRTNGSEGYQRCKETDIDKIQNSINMLYRVVKMGLPIDFVLTDSWFFCYELLFTLTHIANGKIKLLSMAKMGNQKYTLLRNGNEYNANALIKIHQRKIQHCRKLKAHYIKIACLYKDIRVNLFFVKMGRSTSWKLLVTNDTGLNFVSMMKIYSIRWSIEVFFKEGKQYLNLGRSLSQNFDAQIADTTISMIQYIMLVFKKRITYQQSIGALFEDISNEMVVQNIADKLFELFLELQVLIGDLAGIDILELYRELFRKKETAELIEKIICPYQNLKQAA